MAFLTPTADAIVAGVAYPVEFERELGHDVHELEYWDGVAWQPVAIIETVTPEGTVQYAWDTTLLPNNAAGQLRARGIF